MARKSTMKRVRRGKLRPRETGFIVTWDVDSADRANAARLHRFIYGDTTRSNGKRYRYLGFVEKDGVRYLGQSVLFLTPALLNELTSFLSRNGIEHEVTPAALG